MKWDLARGAYAVIVVFGMISGAFLGARYLLPALLPFLFAYALVALVRGAVRRLSGKNPSRALSATLTLSLLALTLAAASALVVRVVREAGELLEKLTTEPEAVGSGLHRTWAALDAFLDRLPYPLSAGDVPLGERLAGALSDAALGGLPALLSRVASAAPKVFLGLIVFLLASVYLARDGDGVRAFLYSCVPARYRARVGTWRASALAVLGGYVRAYGTLMLLVALVLVVGFLILRVRYALLFSLLIALLDALPVFGVGAVLIPWGIVRLIAGDTRLGVGLLLTYGAAVLVREVFEARLVGRHIGVHPLAALLGMYLGWSLFGVLGLLFGPLGALAAKGIYLTLRPRGAEGPASSGPTSQTTPLPPR